MITEPSQLVLGHALTRENSHAEIGVRLASADEARRLSKPFSRCTVPLVFQTLWNHNLNEWFVRAPVAFHRWRHLLPRELSITIFSPLKLPVPHLFLSITAQHIAYHHRMNRPGLSLSTPSQTNALPWPLGSSQVPHFNRVALRPFSHYDVTSFADFSARHPEGTPSNATAEGVHLRCFRRLFVYREVRCSRTEKECRWLPKGVSVA